MFVSELAMKGLLDTPSEIQPAVLTLASKVIFGPEICHHTAKLPSAVRKLGGVAGTVSGNGVVVVVVGPVKGGGVDAGIIWTLAVPRSTCWE